MTRNQRRRSKIEHRLKMAWVRRSGRAGFAVRWVGWGYHTSIEHIWAEFYWEREHAPH